jgi:hypothetical protein
MSIAPASADIAYATCTNVEPGANGPCTATRRPFAFACGEEPSMMAAPPAPRGSWSTNGDATFTGARAVF